MTLTAYSAITKPTVGNGVSKADEGDKMVDNFTRLHTLEDQEIKVPINGATALVSGDRQYDLIWSKFDGGTIVDVGAACTVGSTSGAVELFIKKNGTSILSTNITIDETETGSLTAAVQPVVNAAVATLAKGDWLEFGVVSPGASVTHLVIVYVVRPSA
jgi:hypothetical protein